MLSEIFTQKKIFAILSGYSLFLLALLTMPGCHRTTPKLNIQHWQTKSGTPVYFVAENQLPMTDITLAFRAGSARDNTQWGIAYLTNALLDEGTADKNTDQLAESLEAVGAVVRQDINRDMGVIKLRSLTDRELLTPALQLFESIVKQPAFPQASITRIKSRVLQALLQRQQYPALVAEDAFYEQLYQNAPYAHRFEGNPQTLAAISRAEIQQFYQRYYTAQNAVITIVGALTNAQAKTIAEALSVALPQGEKSADLPRAPTTQAKTLHIDHPSSQTHVLMGTLGVSRHHPDYYALALANSIVGAGTMTSRLYEEVREKQGLVYSIGGAFIPLANDGPYLINLQTRQAETQHAIKTIQKVLTTFMQEGPTEKEVIAAKKHLIGSLLMRTASNESISAELLTIGFYQLPINRLDTFARDIEKLNVKQLLTAFKKQFDHKPWVIITVGQTSEKAEPR